MSRPLAMVTSRETPARHHAVGDAERRQRQQLAVHDARPAPAPEPACVVTTSASSLEAPPDARQSARGLPSRSSSVRSAAASACSRAIACSGARLPHPDQRRRPAFERLGDAQRARQHRVGFAVLGDQHQRSAVQHRRRPRGAHRRLGGRRGPAPPVRLVPVRQRQRLARLLARVGHPWQFRQRGEGIGSGHEDTLVPGDGHRVGSPTAGPATCSFVAQRAPSAAGGVSCHRRCNLGDYAHSHVRHRRPKLPSVLPALRRVRRAGQRDRRAVRRGRARTGWRSGASRPSGWRGRRRSPRSWTGRRHRSRSGSSAASSTSPTTAWTATSRRATATGSPSTGSASRSTTSAPSPTPNSRTRCAKAANALTELGLVAGDRVAIYMPMVPEAIVAMLACARLGAMHSVVFAGYSASALKARIEDAEAKLVITTDGQYRRGKAASLKEAVDEAVEAVRQRRARSGGAPHRNRRRRGPRAATCGGTTSSTPRRPNTPRRRSTPSTRCSCSTPRAPPASPRASCTPPAAT